MTEPVSPPESGASATPDETAPPTSEDAARKEGIKERVAVDISNALTDAQTRNLADKVIDLNCVIRLPLSFDITARIDGEDRTVRKATAPGYAEMGVKTKDAEWYDSRIGDLVRQGASKFSSPYGKPYDPSGVTLTTAGGSPPPDGSVFIYLGKESRGASLSSWGPDDAANANKFKHKASILWKWTNKNEAPKPKDTLEDFKEFGILPSNAEQFISSPYSRFKGNVDIPSDLDSFSDSFKENQYVLNGTVKGKKDRFKRSDYQKVKNKAAKDLIDDYLKTIKDAMNKAGLASDDKDETISVDEFYEKMKFDDHQVEGLEGATAADNAAEVIKNYFSGTGQQQTFTINGGMQVKLHVYSPTYHEGVQYIGWKKLLEALRKDIKKQNQSKGRASAKGFYASQREKIFNALKEIAKGKFTEGDEDDRIDVLEESTRRVLNAEKEIQKKAKQKHPEDGQKAVRAADDNWRFDPQGYLYYQISTVAGYRQGTMHNQPLKSVRVADVDPNFIMNLVAGANEKRLLDLKTVQAAHLVPRAKFSVIKRNPNGSVSEKHIKFDTYMHKSDVNSIFYGKRGGGVGLTDVEVQFQGTDLVSVDKLFSVKAQFYIQDIERITKANQSNHFMKLISIPHSKDEEIKLELGWNVDDSTGNIIPPGLRHEIRKNRMSLLLGLKDHTFTVNQDGTLILSVDYIGRLEDKLGDFESDIFPATNNAELAKLYRAKRQIESDSFRQAFRAGFEASTPVGEDAPKLDDAAIDRKQRSAQRKAIEKIDKAKRENLRTKYKAILDNLIANGKVYKTNVTDTMVEGFKDYCIIAAADPGGSVSRPQDNLSINPYEPPSSDEGADADTKSEDQKIVFFYMGDFIDTAVTLASQPVGNERKLSQTRDRFDFMMGVVPTVSTGTKSSFTNVGGKERKTYHNLAYMPVTIDTYKEWFEKNVTKKNKVYYPLLDFIKDVANDLVFKVLGGNYLAQTDRLRPPVSKLSVGNLSLNRKSPIFQKKILKQRHFKKLHATSANSLRDVFFLYTLPVRGSAGGMRGNRRQDSLRGIYHIRMGRDRGLLKEMNFAKATIQGWRESQTLKATAQGDRSIFIPAPYNCDIKLIGNTMFKPGMSLFIDPLISGFGSISSKNSIARKLQIGGYYIILGVTHYLKNGIFETSLRCVYNSMPNSNESEQRQMIDTESSSNYVLDKVSSESGAVFGYAQMIFQEAKNAAANNAAVQENRVKDFKNGKKK